MTADDFTDRGADWIQAWEILAEGCEIPPSLEVFEYGLERTRGRSHYPVSVQQYARTLADSYHRVR